MQKPVVNVMVKAARAAGNVLLRNLHKLDGVNIVEKERMDYASEIDEQAEQAILHENAESQNESLDDLKQPGAVPSAAVPTSPPANPR